VDERTGEGYELGGVREFIFKVYTENLPDSVMIDGVKARKGKVWTIDRKAGVCCVALPDDGLRHVIRLHRNVF
jgi:hypothetical protein